MKASTVAAILAFCAHSALSAPVQAGNSQASEAEKREAEPFIGNLIPDFSRINPNDDSPFNPFDDAGLPGKVKRDPEAIFNPTQAMRAFNGFKNVVNLPEKIGDIVKRDPEPVINPVQAMRAFNGFKNVVNLPEKIGDIFKRDPEMYKRDPEAFLGSLADAVSGFGGIPGVAAGRTILDKVTKRDAEPEPVINPTQAMRAFNGFKNVVNLPEKIGDIFKRDPEMYKRDPEAFLGSLADAVSGFGGIPGVQAGRIIGDWVTKRDAEAEPVFNPTQAMRALNGFKNVVNLPEKIGDIFKRDPEMYKRDPEAFLGSLADAVSGFGGIPGVQAGRTIADWVTKRDEGALSARKAEALSILLEDEE